MCERIELAEDEPHASKNEEQNIFKRGRFLEFPLFK